MKQLIVLSLALLAQAASAEAQESSSAQFARTLYRQIAQDGGNVVCSPLSIARVLAMVREGASGETAEELARVLDVGDLQSRNAVFLAALGIGAGKEHPVLDLASSMWGQEGIPFQEPFVEVLKTRYRAEVCGADFRAPETARAAINAWAAKHTGGRVAEAIAPGMLKADSGLVLVDAVHFRAAWESSFPVRLTKPAAFTRSDGRIVQAPTMHQTDYFSHAETARASVLQLSYEGSTLAMVIVLPHGGHDLAEVVEHEDIDAWTRELDSREVEVALPSFRMAWGKNWKPALQEVGISRAFDRKRAEFTRISDEPWFVGAVLQNAYIAVDEEGTEAAAATVISTAPTAAVRKEEPVEFHADRPFLFLIRDTATGVVLFIGRVEDPTA